MASINNIGGAESSAQGEPVNIACRLVAATQGAACDLLIGRVVFESLVGRKFLPPDCVDIQSPGMDRPISALPLTFGNIRWFNETYLAKG